MKLILSAAALAVLLASGPVRADWLADAWSDQSVRRNGSPAITIGRNSIHVVLPEHTLRQAHAEGMTTERAVGDFLEKYGQRCSGLLDLNARHAALKVKLSLQTRSSFDDIPDGDAVLAEMKAEFLKRYSDRGSPVLFTVAPDHVELTIDYVPTRQVRCVAPEMPSS